MINRFKLWLAKKLLFELCEMGVAPAVFLKPMVKGHRECYPEDNAANVYWLFREDLELSVPEYDTCWNRNGSYGHFKTTRGKQS